MFLENKMRKKIIGITGCRVVESLGNDIPFFESVPHMSISDNEFSSGSSESSSHDVKAS